MSKDREVIEFLKTIIPGLKEYDDTGDGIYIDFPTEVINESSLEDFSTVGETNSEMHGEIYVKESKRGDNINKQGEFIDDIKNKLWNVNNIQLQTDDFNIYLNKIQITEILKATDKQEILLLIKIIIYYNLRRII